MIELYRGLIDIFIFQFRSLDEQLTAHVRDTTQFPFWNFMLEITFLLFSKLAFVSAVVMITGLAIAFFPLYALMNVLVSVLNHRAEFESDQTIYISPLETTATKGKK
jgi:hypothetical protein